MICTTLCNMKKGWLNKFWLNKWVAIAMAKKAYNAGGDDGYENTNELVWRPFFFLHPDTINWVEQQKGSQTEPATYIRIIWLLTANFKFREHNLLNF